MSSATVNAPGGRVLHCLIAPVWGRRGLGVSPQPLGSGPAPHKCQPRELLRNLPLHLNARRRTKHHPIEYIFAPCKAPCRIVKVLDAPVSHERGMGKWRLEGICAPKDSVKLLSGHWPGDHFEPHAGPNRDTAALGFITMPGMNRELNTLDRIRILSVDDHPLLRQGIAAIINNQSDMVLVSQASNGAEELSQYQEYRPDVTLMDLRLPDLSGIDVVIAIRAEFEDARIIMLTTFEGDVEIQRVLEAGARGYLLQSMPPSQTGSAIPHVHAGKKHGHAEV